MPTSSAEPIATGASSREMTANGRDLNNTMSEPFIGVERQLDPKGKAFWKSVTKVMTGWEEQAIRFDETAQLQEKPFHSVPPEFHPKIPPELPAETAEGKALKAMLDGGMSLDEAASVLKALGENSTRIPPEFHPKGGTDSAMEKRRKWDREYRRRRKLAAEKPAENSTRIPPESISQRHISLSDSPLVEELPIKKESKRDSGKRASATRLPPDFHLTDERRAFAATLLPEQRIQIEFDKFCDHWRAKSGKDATKVDWNATWRNWCRNDYGGRNARPGPGIPNSRAGNPSGGFGNGPGPGGGQNRSRGGFSAFAVQSARRAAERMERGGQHNPGEGVVELDSEPRPAGTKTRPDGK